MGIVEQKLNDYVWKYISLLEAIFSEKIYKILLRFKEKEDRESFSDMLEAVVEVDSELLEKIETIFQNYAELELDEIYKNIGNSYYQKGEYEKALEYYQKAININPKHTSAHYNIGIIYQNRNEDDKALEYYQKAININPKYVDAYNNIGIIYQNRNEDDKALEYYQKAININPKYALAHNNMAIIYDERNEDDKALEYFQKSIRITLEGDAFHNLNLMMKSLDKAFFLDKEISNLNLFINKLKIQNFKQYKKFSIDFSEKINIIIGQNAIGKTTLLQAITLGLLKEDSSDVKTVEFDSFISKGQEKSELIVYHNDEEKKIEILKDKREIDKNYFIPFVLAYGSNFFTSKTNEVKEVAQGIVNKKIHKDFASSIFVDYTSGFVNPIRLLEFLDLEKDEKVSEIQETFIKTINSFLEGFTLVANDKNYYFQKDNQEAYLRLEDLSEGYRGNVLLITDMLIKILGVGYTPETIEGIVLIDEFDKHLHPRWQSKLVNQLRDTFPKIQFIMTTHNPMSLLGRKANEITILKEVDGEIVAEKKQGTESIDVSIVLLEYFNVKSTVSESMQKDISDFNRLKLKKELTEEEKKELEELEKFLGNTVASNLIYNRPYLKFLEFMRDHKEIDFEQYEKLNDDERNKLLEEFGDLFDD